MNDLNDTPFKAGCGILRRWEIEDVIAEYDNNLNLTLKELSQRSRWDISELKKLLLND